MNVVPERLEPQQADYRPKLMTIATVLMILFLVGMLLVDQMPWFSHINRATGGLLVGLFIVNVFFRPRMVPLEILLFLLFILWAGITGLAVAQSKINYIGSLKKLNQVWLLALAVSGFARYAVSPGRNFFAFIVTSLVLVGYIIATGGIEVAQQGGRISGLVSNANTLGFIMLYGITCTLYFWDLPKRRWMKPILMGLLGILVLVLIYSGSRKSFLCLLLLFAAWLWYCHRDHVLKNFTALLTVLIVTAGLYFFAQYTMEKTALGARFETAGDALEGRFSLYITGWDLFTDNVVNSIAGVGLYNFQLYSPGAYEAHSSYVEILVDTGLVGFLIFLCLVMVSWRRLSHIVKYSDDRVERQIAGLGKAFIVMLLALSLGAPTFHSPFAWFMFASFIGYSQAIVEKMKERGAVVISSGGL